MMEADKTLRKHFWGSNTKAENFYSILSVFQEMYFSLILNLVSEKKKKNKQQGELVLAPGASEQSIPLFEWDYAKAERGNFLVK